MQFFKKNGKYINIYLLLFFFFTFIVNVFSVTEEMYIGCGVLLFLLFSYNFSQKYVQSFFNKSLYNIYENLIFYVINIYDYNIRLYDYYNTEISKWLLLGDQLKILFKAFLLKEKLLVKKLENINFFYIIIYKKELLSFIFNCIRKSISMNYKYIYYYMFIEVVKNIYSLELEKEDEMFELNMKYLKEICIKYEVEISLEMEEENNFEEEKSNF